MNIAICDDDKYFCQVLKDKLLKKFHENCGEIVIVDIYTDSTVFINEGTQHNYQLVFLDIDMPNENGFSVADKIANTISDCYFVFVTSHDSLVFEAIKKHPFGFVRKTKLQTELEPLIDDFLSADFNNKKFYIIKKYNNIERLPVCNIKYVEAKGNHVLFYTDENVHSKKGKISDVEMELPQKQFVRISRSFIVNLAQVYGAITTTGLTLKTGEHLPVSRERINQVKKAYLHYLRGEY